MTTNYWGDPDCPECAGNPYPYVDCERCIEYNAKIDISRQHIPGAKLDDGKIDMSLLQFLPNAIIEVCRVLDYGQTKYSRGGFLEVPNAIVRYSAAMLRHYFKESSEVYDDDPFYDTEKGLPFKGKIRHDAQVAVNALFRLECNLREAKQDARLLRMSDELEDYYE